MNDVPNRLRVGLLFGGRSAEHEISLKSANNVFISLDPQKYEVYPIFITIDGKWLLCKSENGVLGSPDQNIEVCIVPGAGGQLLLVGPGLKLIGSYKIDVLFPVLHGIHGEDGSVQGVAEIVQVPYVGSGIMSSAITLNKIVTKRLVAAAGLRVARCIVLQVGGVHDFLVISKELGLPFFIKPAKQGSSVGARKVECMADFILALDDAFKYDKYILAEEYIFGREIEVCLVRDVNNERILSVAGEIKYSDKYGFYDYEAKYKDLDSTILEVPANLSQSILDDIIMQAEIAFNSVDCEFLARVDMFLCENNHIVINEINTIPGFTETSMFPKAILASGFNNTNIFDLLIKYGVKRFNKE